MGTHSLLRTIRKNIEINKLVPFFKNHGIFQATNLNQG